MNLRALSTPIASLPGMAGRVLNALRLAPMTRNELCSRLMRSRTTVQEVLSDLESQALVRVCGTKRGRVGAPSQLWERAA